MALSKKPEAVADEVAAAEEEEAPAEAVSADTPSALANAEVGELSEDASDEERAELAARWNAAKRRAQRGF